MGPFRKQGGKVVRWETPDGKILKFVVYQESNRFSLHVRRYRRKSAWLADHRDKRMLFKLAHMLDKEKVWKGRL